MNFRANGLSIGKVWILAIFLLFSCKARNGNDSSVKEVVKAKPSDLFYNSAEVIYLKEIKEENYLVLRKCPPRIPVNMDCQWSKEDGSKYVQESFPILTQVYKEEIAGKPEATKILNELSAHAGPGLHSTELSDEEWATAIAPFTLGGDETTVIITLPEVKSMVKSLIEGRKCPVLPFKLPDLFCSSHFSGKKIFLKEKNRVEDCLNLIFNLAGYIPGIETIRYARDYDPHSFTLHFWVENRKLPPIEECSKERE